MRQEGYDACRRGLLQKNNPYPPDTVEYEQWNEGWLEAYHLGLANADLDPDPNPDDYELGM